MPNEEKHECDPAGLRFLKTIIAIVVTASVAVLNYGIILPAMISSKSNALVALGISLCFILTTGLIVLSIILLIRLWLWVYSQD